MKHLILIGFLFSLWSGFNKIAETNALKRDAENAFVKNDFKKASELYLSLIVNYQVKDEPIRLNLAHSYFKTGNNKRALEQYSLLIKSNNAKIKSVAYQQLGVISALKGKNAEALKFLKEALKTDSRNEQARYNYELIKKLNEHEALLNENIETQKTKDKKGNEKDKERLVNTLSNNGITGQVPDGKNKELFSEDTPGKDGKSDLKSNSDNSDKDLKEKETGDKRDEALRLKRLAEMNMNEEKARAILESIKDKEIQYLQEIRKKNYNKNYKDKPDW
ncbi:MAG: hypothetical protein K2X86_05105 [Cytophagaceae bacterium]|nr:hypothetical protein [Cytophagaceae bacterium]